MRLLMATAALVFIVGTAFVLSIEVWRWTSIAAFFAATLIPTPLVRRLLKMRPAASRQPNLYGTSKFADTKAMRAGGITSEKR